MSEQYKCNICTAEFVPLDGVAKCPECGTYNVKAFDKDDEIQSLKNRLATARCHVESLKERVSAARRAEERLKKVVKHFKDSRLIDLDFQCELYADERDLCGDCVYASTCDQDPMRYLNDYFRKAHNCFLCWCREKMTKTELDGIKGDEAYHRRVDKQMEKEGE